MKKTLAITGGAGFLGYHLCNHLKNKYKEIRVIDRQKLNPNEYPKNVKFYNFDIRDHKDLVKAFEGVDEIIHAAAALPLWKKKEIYSVNVKGTKSVLDAAMKNKIKRMVLISSTAVYGVPDKHPLYENDKLIGVGPYGITKIKKEKLADRYRKKGMFITTIRPKTFIGTGRLGVFQILYDWVESGTKIPIIGKGKNRYQLLEVTDLCEAIYLSLKSRNKKANGVFNIGADNFGTVKHDVGALCEYASNGSRTLSFPVWMVLPVLEVAWWFRMSPLYKWVYGTAYKDSFVSVDKAKEILKWKPKYSNAEALIRSYEWYLEHKDELKGEEGVTHRVAWKQGILGIAKKFL